MFSILSKMKLETKHKRKSEEFTNKWELTSSLLNNKLAEEEIREIRKYFKMNENKTPGDQNLRDAVEAVLLRKLIVANIFSKKEKRAQINNVA